MIYKILLIGPQGSGKGTQAEILAKRLGVPSFAMGQLLRDEVAAGSAVGQMIDGVLKSGNLVSDAQAAEVLKARLARPDTQKGYILDGYPRNLAQYAAFDFDEPTHVLVIEVPHEESMRRLGGRLTCAACGRIRSISMGAKPGDPCECGGTFTVRADDTPEAIKRRLEVYDQDTIPMIAEFEKRGLVRRIDGMGSVEDVTQRIAQALGL